MNDRKYFMRKVCTVPKFIYIELLKSALNMTLR